MFEGLMFSQLHNVLVTCDHIGSFDSEFPVHLVGEWLAGGLQGSGCVQCIRYGIWGAVQCLPIS